MNLMQITIIAASLIAYKRPVILLNGNWQSMVKRILDFFMKVQIAILISVVFIDGWKYIFVFLKSDFTGQLPSEEERSLNLITRITQGMILLIFGMVINIWWEHRQKNKRRQKDAQKILDEFKKFKVDEWTEEMQCKECSICLAEFHEKDKITKLNCHHTHIYHHSCF